MSWNNLVLIEVLPPNYASERDATEVLNRLYTEKLINNSHRELQESMHELRDSSHNELIRKINVDEAMQHDPEMKAMTARENACFSAFETILRSRSTAIPKACDSIAATHLQLLSRQAGLFWHMHHLILHLYYDEFFVV